MSQGAALLLFEDSTVTLSSEDARHLGLKPGDGLLACGRKTAPVRFRLGASAHTLEIPFSLLSLFGLSAVETGTIGLYRGPDRIPRLGPVVTMLHSLPAPELPFFEGLFAQNLARECREKGLLFSLMLPDQFDFVSRQGYGALAVPQGVGRTKAAWQDQPVPLPDLIFNQVALLLPGQEEPYGRVWRSYSTRPGGFPVLLTRGGLNKTKAFQLLAADDLASSYLPCTRTVHSVAAIQDLLLEFGQVFLKPEGGSHGLNIIRLTDQGSAVLAEFRLGNENVRRSLASPDELESFLRPAFSASTYVCQQAIRRPEVDGGVVDFRVGLARNDRGEWEVCYYRLKHAPPGAICTNWGYGTAWYDLEDMMDRVFPGRESVVREALDRCGLAVARAVSGAEGGDCCQLAVDVVLDPDRHPWVLEVNERPEHGEREGQRVAHRLAGYFVLIAGAAGRLLVRVLPVAG